MKKMVPNKQGSRLGALRAGDIIEDTYTYEFMGQYDPNTGLPSSRVPPEERKHYVDHRTAHATLGGQLHPRGNVHCRGVAFGTATRSTSTIARRTRPYSLL